MSFLNDPDSMSQIQSVNGVVDCSVDGQPLAGIIRQLVADIGTEAVAGDPVASDT